MNPSLSPVVLLLLLAAIPEINAAEEFNYEDLGQDIWSDDSPSCAGQSQSPINIQTACTTYQQFSAFQFSTSYNNYQIFTLLNNGHTVSGAPKTEPSPPLSISGGGLSGTYTFVGFHLHWGQTRKSRSEHEVNSAKYAGEIHLVHKSSATGALAVLGIFMDSSADHNGNGNNLNLNRDGTSSAWANYFNFAPTLTAAKNTVDVNLSLAVLVQGNRNDFWRYSGSLTTPPCTEGVTWTVFKEPIYFTEAEIRSLREHVLPKNARETQPLYNRTVLRSFLTETLSSVPDENYCVPKTVYLQTKSTATMTYRSVLVIALSLSIAFIM